MIACPSCGADNPERYRLCGQCGTPLATGRATEEIRRFATVVNSDLKGSTALGEKLDPESLREVLTRYFDEMRLVFESHGGTIEKIIGDAIVAVFGMPVRRDDDAIRAVEAAAESIAVLANLNDQLDRTWGVRLITRTGVSTGDVVFGEATAGQHVLTGDTMRISSAMEQNAPPLEILIAEPTYALVRDHVQVEPMPPVSPKGMNVAIPSYRLISVAAHAGAHEALSSSTPLDAQVCPTCGAENEPDSKLCGTCGGTLAARTAARESRKTVTLVFADPKPTSLTGEPPSAEALRDVMTRYFDAMRLALARHGGTVEKFIGDAVMAVFGLPVRHEDDAIRAIRAAAEMQAALPALNDAFREEWGVELRNHVGVNTGEVITGDATTGQRLVTGDAVNTAARLEQAAGPMEIILGDLTYRLARDQIDVEVIPPLTLKGKAEPVPAYRLIRVRDRPAERETEAAPFVGREAEMSRLSEALLDAGRHKRARLLTVVGEAGVGKSRLIKEFAAGVPGHARVVRGRCLPYGDGITFWPLAEIVRDAAAITGDDAQEAAIRKIRGLLASAELDDQEQMAVADRIAAAIGLAHTQFPVAELFWGARKLLESLAREQPLVMIVDDIHSAEPTFLDLLDHLLGTVEGAPILLLCAARHELVERHADWSEAHADRLIVLEPLSDGDTGRMIGELLGQAGLDSAIVGRIVAAAEGNPLFVEQMVSMLVDNGTLRREADRWVVTGAAGDIVVPPTIHALLAARLDDLADNEREVVEPASIVGLVFAQAAVEHLVEVARRPTVRDNLTSLARKQFVKADVLDNDAAFRFGHQLIRDTAYGSLLKRERVVLHERFVDWADQINRQQGRETEFEEILGYHLEQAYRYRSELGPLDEHAVATGSRASTRLASAGRRALARGDFPAAANLLNRAARLLDDQQPERPRLLVSAGEAYMEIGEFAKAHEVLVKGASEAEAIGERSVRITAELVRLQLHLRSEASTSIDDVMRQTLAGIADLEATGDNGALARAWRLLELVHGVSGRYKPAGNANEKAIEYAKRAGDRVLEMRLYASSAQAVLSGPMPVPNGIARCEALIQIGEGDRRAQAMTLAALAHLRAMNADFDRARDDYRRGRAILEELGLRFDASTMSIDSGPVELLAGDPGAAEAELRKDYEALDAIGERNYISSIAGLLAEALYRQGRFEEAMKYATFCAEIAAPSDVYSQYLWRGIRGKLLARDGAADAGIQLAASGVTETRASDDIEGQGNALMFLAEAQAAAGRSEDAVRSAEEARGLFEAKGNIVSAGRAGDLVALAGGGLSATGSVTRLET
jgi:class 3 adenylate cyclase/predicted ATPase